MKLLLDTHVLLWATGRVARLSDEARRLIEDTANEVVFSAISIAEIAIKYSLGRPDFRTEPGFFRNALIANGYQELPMTGTHAIALSSLPPIHKDPFDRMLVAQARSEGMTLLTSDDAVALYPGAIRRV